MDTKNVLSNVSRNGRCGTQFSDLHPDGDQLGVLQNVSGATNAEGVASGSERFLGRHQLVHRVAGTDGQ